MKTLKAIFFIPNCKTRKYNVANNPKAIKSFESFCRKINVTNINYYDKESEKFLYQVQLNKNSPS